MLDQAMTVTVYQWMVVNFIILPMHGYVPHASPMCF